VTVNSTILKDWGRGGGTFFNLDEKREKGGEGGFQKIRKTRKHKEK